jgi:hypothetical protein
MWPMLRRKGTSLSLDFPRQLAPGKVPARYEVTHWNHFSCSAFVSASFLGNLNMSSTTLRKSATNPIKSANDQIQRMKDEIEASVRDTIAPTVADIVAKAAASAIYGSNQVREYSDTVAGGVRNRPLLSVVFASVLGFVAGRLTAGLVAE